MQDLFLRVMQIIPSFDVADPKILPYGLKPHTRSVSWIAEQVIALQAKDKSEKPGIQNKDKVHTFSPQFLLLKQKSRSIKL